MAALGRRRREGIRKDIFFYLLTKTPHTGKCSKEGGERKKNEGENE